MTTAFLSIPSVVRIGREEKDGNQSGFQFDDNSISSRGMVIMLAIIVGDTRYHTT